jgi:hypothetical protein
MSMDPAESVSMFANMPNVVHESGLEAADAASRNQAQMWQMGRALLSLKNSGRITPEQYAAGLRRLGVDWQKATGDSARAEPWFNKLKAVR